MKMRILIGVLLVLNAAVLAWQFDAFARWGWGPNVGREPERLQQQVQPEAIKFSAPAVAASEASASSSAVSEASSVAKDAVAAEEAAAASAAARAARKRARAAAAAASAAAESQ